MPLQYISFYVWRAQATLRPAITQGTMPLLLIGKLKVGEILIQFRMATAFIPEGVRALYIQHA
jgi:hypothetical protein